MSVHLLRTVATAAVLSLASLSDTRAQEAFAPADLTGASAGVALPEGEVLKVDAAAAPTNAYRLITRGHATWLASRGPYEFPHRAHVVVYLDGARIGGREALRRIPANQIAEVRRLTPAQAVARFGADHGAGAILLTSN